MTSRQTLRRLLLLALATAWPTASATALADVPAGEVAKGPVTAQEIRAALEEKMTLDFSSETLGEALDHLRGKTKVSFVLDTLVLQQLGMGGPNDLPAPVRLKANKGRVGAALLRMLEPYHLTYVILGDRVLVTSDDVAHYRQMRQRVSVEANALPADEVLRKLARQTAVNLVIDPRVAKQVKTPVTLEQEDITMETAVRLLTFMADLRAVAIGDVLLVTTEERAEKLTKQPDTPRPPLIGGPELLEGPGTSPRAVPAPSAPPKSAGTEDRSTEF